MTPDATATWEAAIQNLQTDIFQRSTDKFVGILPLYCAMAVVMLVFLVGVLYIAYRNRHAIQKFLK